MADPASDALHRFLTPPRLSKFDGGSCAAFGNNLIHIRPAEQTFLIRDHAMRVASCTNTVNVPVKRSPVILRPTRSSVREAKCFALPRLRSFRETRRFLKRGIAYGKDSLAYLTRRFRVCSADGSPARNRAHPCEALCLSRSSYPDRVKPIKRITRGRDILRYVYRS